MEESQPLQIDREEENGDEFYEQIEAPKFVDLTAPDHYHPGDDRYWFCLRVGCDQKHEEEMDSEAIYKNFVIRVMAARSPNIRIRKALYRKDSSTLVKYPQTVPAKSSKSRISRLALISSMSKRMVDPKVQVQALSKQGATPNVKAKQSAVAAKALTTPSNKKRLSNPDTFRSVRNPNARAIAVPKNRVVAKALVFQSPKKSVRAKASLELNTPVKTLCAGMKKLEINGGKKHVLGYNRPLPSDATRKQTRGRDVKSRVYDGLFSQNHKGQAAKSSKCLKKNNKEKNLQHYPGPVPHQGVENDFSDMEIEDKSRNGSLGVCSTSRSDEENVHEGHLITAKISKPSLGENKAEASSDAGRRDLNSLSNSKGRSPKKSDVPEFQAASGEGNQTNERRNQEKKMKSSLEKGTNEIIENDDKKNPLTSDDKENNGEVVETDDKENAPASDDNIELDPNTGRLKGKILGKRATLKGTQKITRAISKPSKGSSITAATVAQGLKHRKPKPTNPKPFRLRTDERGILKEANLEKKLHLAPLKEITPVSRFPEGSSLKKQQKAFQRNEKYLEHTECANETKYSEKETNRTHIDQHQNGTSNLKIPKERVERKLSTTTPQRQTVSSQQKLVIQKQDYNQDKAAKKVGSTSKRTKSPFVRRFARPQEAHSNTREMVSIKTPGQLGVIKETSPKILRPKEPAKPSENGTSPLTKASASAASRQSLQGKRLTTIPKEPNFHPIHVPKNCTRRAT